MSKEKLLNHFEIKAIKESIKECKVIAITLDLNPAHMTNYNVLLNFKGIFLCDWTIFQPQEHISNEKDFLSHYLEDFNDVVGRKCDSAERTLNLIDNFKNGDLLDTFLNQAWIFLRGRISELAKYCVDNRISNNIITIEEVANSFERNKDLLFKSKSIFDLYQVMLLELNIDTDKIVKSALDLEKRQQTKKYIN